MSSPWSLNDYLSSFRATDGYGFATDVSCIRDRFPIAKRIVCVDGFSISVQANEVAYCSPRENIGPWHKVEVGFPSDTPDLIMSYAECETSPTRTVYGYVPIELVEELIASHGGVNEDTCAAIAKATGCAV